jgi:hypothetical protein
MKLLKKSETTELSEYGNKFTGHGWKRNNVHGNINIEGNIGLSTLIRNDAKNRNCSGICWQTQTNSYWLRRLWRLIWKSNK